jgi:uncharacterized membrane protein
MLRRLSRGLVEAIRRYFVAGLLAFAPIAITLWAIAWIIQRLDNLLLPRVLEWLMPGTTAAPQLPPLVGALFTFVVILLAGVFVRHLFGHNIVRLTEHVLKRVPIARSIYAGVKQLFEAIFVNAPTRQSFNTVVLVEYPRKGLYAIAFTTGEASDPVAAAVEGPLISCFVPTTPNPTSGIYILARPQELTELDLSVEEAFKVIMSAGIVEPTAAGKLGDKQPELFARAVGD